VQRILQILYYVVRILDGDRQSNQIWRWGKPIPQGVRDTGVRHVIRHTYS